MYRRERSMPSEGGQIRRGGKPQTMALTCLGWRWVIVEKYDPECDAAYQRFALGNLKQLFLHGTLTLHSHSHCMAYCSCAHMQVDGSYEDWLEILRLMYYSGAVNTLMFP
jgi:hypothetical protein